MRESQMQEKRPDEKNSFEAVNSFEQATAVVPATPPLPAPTVETKPDENDVIDEKNKRAYSVAFATVAAAEVAVAAAQVVVEVVRPTTPRFVGKLKEKIAAIRIPTAFRGYLIVASRFISVVHYLILTWCAGTTPKELKDESVVVDLIAEEKQHCSFMKALTILPSVRVRF